MNQIDKKANVDKSEYFLNVAETQVDSNTDESVLFEARKTHLKTEINNLIWMFANSKISLGQADRLACKIYEQITDTDDYDREN